MEFNIHIPLYIPFWRGYSITISYGDKDWHTGKWTVLFAPVKYIVGCGFGMNTWKFYHTGLYIGDHENYTANN